MKRSILLLTAVIGCLYSVAQGTYNLVLFSEDGEPFFAFVNGVRQNDKPETNIRVTDLNSQAIIVRVQFENAALPTLKQNMAPEAGYEHTIRIKKTVKKVMKMQYFGKVELAQAPRTNATNVLYHTAENTVTPGDEQYINNTTDPAIDPSIDPTTGTSITSTTTSVNTSVNQNSTMNVSGPGININITTSDVPANSSVSSSTMVTSTSTSSSVSYHHPQSNHSPKHANTKPTNNINTVNTTSSASSSITPRPMNPALSSTSVGSGTGNQGMTVATSSAIPKNHINSACGTPMSDEAYEKLKTSIDDKPFEDNKMSMAQAATKSNCLTVAQIKGICDLFAMDDHKLAYAKYAYPYCLEKQNYFQVSDVFTFPRYTEDLNKFLQQQK